MLFISVLIFSGVLVSIVIMLQREGFITPSDQLAGEFSGDSDWNGLGCRCPLRSDADSFVYDSCLIAGPMCTKKTCDLRKRQPVDGVENTVENAVVIKTAHCEIKKLFDCKCPVDNADADYCKDASDINMCLASHCVKNGIKFDCKAIRP